MNAFIAAIKSLFPWYDMIATATPSTDDKAWADTLKIVLDNPQKGKDMLAALLAVDKLKVDPKIRSAK